MVEFSQHWPFPSSPAVSGGWGPILLRWPEGIECWPPTLSAFMVWSVPTIPSSAITYGQQKCKGRVRSLKKFLPCLFFSNISAGSDPVVKNKTASPSFTVRRKIWPPPWALTGGLSPASPHGGAHAVAWPGSSIHPRETWSKLPRDPPTGWPALNRLGVQRLRFLCSQALRSQKDFIVSRTREQQNRLRGPITL